jgi:hypothetical protein
MSSSSTSGDNLDGGGDWDGKYQKEESLPLSSIPLRAQQELEALESTPASTILDHPLVKSSPFIASGLALLLGAKIGYGRQVAKYEIEESKWGEKKDKWGRKVMVPRQVTDMPKHWSPHSVAVRALGLGTMVACGSFALGTGLTFWYFDVDSPQEFSEKMKVVIPPKFKYIQDSVRPSLESLKSGLGSLFGQKSEGKKN